jgi:hypothetical protein
MLYDFDGFTVWESKPHIRSSLCLISQATEEEAIAELLREE